MSDGTLIVNAQSAGMVKQLRYLVGTFFRTMYNVGISQAFEDTYYYFWKKYLLSTVPPLRPHPRPFSLLRKLSSRRGRAVREARRLIGTCLEERHPLKGRFAVIYGAEVDFSATETVLVAHWDPDNIVDCYVRRMCRHFRSLGKKVVLCSAAMLKQNVAGQDWADAIVCRKCPGYDFTSWKVALEAFPSLYACDELTFCNDSVFAPVGSYEPVYAAMEPIACDFWGMAHSLECMPHLQSYHVVLRKTVLQHPAFERFLSAVPCAADRILAIGLELRLGLWLELHGLRPGVYIAVPWHCPRTMNSSIYLWDKLIMGGFPAFKRTLLSNREEPVPLDGWWNLLLAHGYPVELISGYYARIGRSLSDANFVDEECPEPLGKSRH